jgi:hypothetical protein
VAAQGGQMDFIERLFSISPDGGSGTFEVLLFVIPMMGYLALRARARRKRTKDAMGT